MTLDLYLAKQQLTPTEFARRCGLSPSTVTRLLAGDRSPGMELLTIIFEGTHGEVTPNDFLPPRLQGEMPQEGAAA